MPHDSLERERALKDINKQRDKAVQKKKKIKVYSSDCYKWRRFKGGWGEEIIGPYVTTIPHT